MKELLIIAYRNVWGEEYGYQSSNIGQKASGDDAKDKVDKEDEDTEKDQVDKEDEDTGKDKVDKEDVDTETNNEMEVDDKDVGKDV
jgi:hypothetical protein